MHTFCKGIIIVKPFCDTRFIFLWYCYHVTMIKYTVLYIMKTKNKKKYEKINKNEKYAKETIEIMLLLWWLEPYSLLHILEKTPFNMHSQDFFPMEITDCIIANSCSIVFCCGQTLCQI